MSRTYRRKEGIGPGYQDKKWTCCEWDYDENGIFNRIPLDPESKEYKRKSAIYHSDAGSHNFKEPGPRWFRNLFNTRPLRREWDRQIHLYMRNEDYEPMFDTKGKRPYWT